MGRDLEAEGNINDIREISHPSDALDPGSSETYTPSSSFWPKKPPATAG